jgi:hypothetical protein
MLNYTLSLQSIWIVDSRYLSKKSIGETIYTLSGRFSRKYSLQRKAESADIHYPLSKAVSFQKVLHSPDRRHQTFLGAHHATPFVKVTVQDAARFRFRVHIDEPVEETRVHLKAENYSVSFHPRQSRTQLMTVKLPFHSLRMIFGRQNPQSETPSLNKFSPKCASGPQNSQKSQDPPTSARKRHKTLHVF